jgi:hypothetical protein
MLFQTLDAEALELLKPASGGMLLEDLSKVRVIVVYQIIRLFYGNLNLRTIAEQRESLIGTCGIPVQLTQQAGIEFRGTESTWENWILAESIRRTVLLAFMFCSIY